MISRMFWGALWPFVVFSSQCILQIGSPSLTPPTPIQKQPTHRFVKSMNWTGLTGKDMAAGDTANQTKRYLNMHQRA